MGTGPMIDGLEGAVTRLDRSDLASAAGWLRDHPPPHTPDAICHGDLHPFNLLVGDDGHVTVLDWSAGQIAPRLYDMAFTTLVLTEPPLTVPSIAQPAVRRAGRHLATRFLRSYEEASGLEVDRAALGWFQGLVCLRALAEVATWVVAGEIDRRAGHPWVLAGDAFAARLTALTCAPVAPR